VAPRTRGRPERRRLPLTSAPCGASSTSPRTSERNDITAQHNDLNVRVRAEAEPTTTSAGAILDRRAFERGFEEHFSAIHGFIARRVGVPLADDLAAETFATAFRRRASFEPGRGTLRAWLYGIAVNLLRNHWRAERYLLDLDARMLADLGLGEDDTAADDRVCATAVAPRVAAALASLVDDQREVIVLHAWTELSHTEIAAALGVPLGTVRSRLSRARAALREQLGAFDFDLWSFDSPASPPASREDRR
jgi:RNA polymerase sigma factor (sigma-70 family)